MAVKDVITRGIGPASGIAFFVTGGYAISDVTEAASLSGSLIEHDVRRGGEELYLSLTDETWVSGSTFRDARQAIINGLTSAQTEAKGWNAEVRDKLEPPAVRRLSDTVVVIDLKGFTGYETSANETITATVPASAVTAGAAITATPTLTVTSDGLAGIENTDASTESSHYEICDRTGFRVRPGELEGEWSGQMVRPKSFEERHPQDFVKSRSSEKARGPIRPEQDDTFISTAVTVDDL